MYIKKRGDKLKKTEYIDILSMDIDGEHEKRKLKKAKDLEAKEATINKSILEKKIDKVGVLNKTEEPKGSSVINSDIANSDIARRRYIKYVDGGFIYYYNKGWVKPMFDKFNKFLSKETADNERRIIVDDVKKKFEFKSVINIVLTIFLIISIIFVYLNYIQEPSGDVVAPVDSMVEDTPLILKPEVAGDNIENEINKENIATVSAESLSSSAILTLNKISNRENQKVLDYVNLKGNRKALTSTLKSSQREKESVYINFVKNKEAFSNNDSLYNDTESLIIKESVKTSKLLEAIENNFSNAELENIVNSYSL